MFQNDWHFYCFIWSMDRRDVSSVYIDGVKVQTHVGARPLVAG
jgi:hypothetical protein